MPEYSYLMVVSYRRRYIQKHEIPTKLKTRRIKSLLGITVIIETRRKANKMPYNSYLMVVRYYFLYYY